MHLYMFKERTMISIVQSWTLLVTTTAAIISLKKANFFSISLALSPFVYALGGNLFKI